MALPPLETTVTVDSATWAALALTLTIVGALLSLLAWRRRGPAAGIRGIAWTLVPVALWLTGTLKLALAIVNDVLHWAARLVFSPTVWLGIIVAGLAVALFVVAGFMRARGVGTRGRAPRQAKTSEKNAAVPAASRASAPEDDDMAEIEAILKRHGI